MLQPLINLSLASSWDTGHAGPAILCHCNLPTRHNTKTQQLSLPLACSLPPSLPKPSPPPPLPSCLPSLVWSLKAICEPHSCESTLHARCTNGKKGKSKHWYMERGLKKNILYFILFCGSCLYWAHINSSGPFMHFNSVALSRRSTYFICNPLYLEPEILACQGKWQEREGGRKKGRKRERERGKKTQGHNVNFQEHPRIALQLRIAR